MRTDSRGFTLLELMIVIAIVAILAAIAIPAYQDYGVRAKVIEGLSLSTVAKTAVADTYHSTNAFPNSNEAAGISKAEDIKGTYVRSVSVGEGGTITITYSDKDSTLNGKVIMMMPHANNDGAITWSCSSPSGMTQVPNKYLPANCRTI